MPTGLVTGCSRGIGLAVVCKQLMLGHKIIGISRSMSLEMQNLLDKYPSTFTFIEKDLSLSLTADSSFLNFAFHNIDYAVINAGIRSRLPIFESSINDYSKVIEINTLVPILIAKLLAQRSIARKSNLKLVFLSSIVGNLGFHELSTYAASKSALDGFMRSFAVDMAPYNIQANCIAPGFVKTSYYRNFIRTKPDLYQWTLTRTPMRRWASPMEIAKCIEFLVSSSNSYMTGTSVYCDGGWTSS